MKWFLDNLLGVRRAPRLSSRAPTRRPQCRRMTVEQLPDRIVPAVKTSFVGGVLTVTGDGASNNIKLFTIPGDVIVVNDGLTGITGATVRNTARINVYGNGGDDTIDLSDLIGLGRARNDGHDILDLFGGTGSGAPVTIDGGAGNDTIEGSPSNDTIRGGAGNDHLYGLGGHDTLDGGGDNDYLYGGAGNDTLLYRFDRGYYDGDAGSDTLSPAGTFLGGTSFLVTGTNRGGMYGQHGTQDFVDVENLNGTPGPDLFYISREYHTSEGKDGSLTGAINGGGGSDFLEYSLYYGDDPGDGVYVNLSTGTADFVGGGVSQVENVMGSAYNDVLIGDDANNVLVGDRGNDSLFGQGGRDILIGGDDADLLMGGSGEDILIGASTDYDDDFRWKFVNLQDLWGGPGSVLSRAADIWTSATPLTAAQLNDDGDSDTLLGGPDQDWILSASPDVVSQ